MATDLTEKNREVTIQEMDKLLAFAEVLQEKCDRLEDRASIGRALILILSVACFTVGTLLYQFGSQNVMMIWIIPGVFGFLATYFAGHFWFTISRNLRREKRALFSIVDMLRELEKAILDTDQLSSLERAEMRIRLSRFDIGSGDIQPN